MKLFQDRLCDVKREIAAMGFSGSVADNLYDMVVWQISGAMHELADDQAKFYRGSLVLDGIHTIADELIETIRSGVHE